MVHARARALTELAERVEAEIELSAAEGLVPWSDARFCDLAFHVLEAQRQNVPVYGRWCEVASERERAHRDHAWPPLPALPIAAFKTREVRAPGAPVVATWRSSGTSGSGRSRHMLGTCSTYDASLLAAAAAALVPDRDERPVRAVQLVPSGTADPDSSLSHMLDLVRTRLCSDGGVHATAAGVDCERAATALEADGEPVLVLATSFALVWMFDWLRREGRVLALAPGSRVMDTGGYKGRTRELTREELLADVGHFLGVEPSWCENEFGMSELSSQSYLGTIARACGRPVTDEDAPRWQPPWFRTLVVDPLTLHEVDDGEVGVLVHCDLANIWSCALVRTEDIGIRRGQSFELLGRAPGAELRGCSLRFEQVGT